LIILFSVKKAKAVATEDYATAKKVKAVEGELKNLSAQLAKLVSHNPNRIIYTMLSV
jgi:hypothetical protein